MLKYYVRMLDGKITKNLRRMDLETKPFTLESWNPISKKWVYNAEVLGQTGFASDADHYMRITAAEAAKITGENRK